MMFRKVTDNFYAAPQIGLDDVAAAKEMGVTLIINNRPDGEEPTAPQGDDIAAAAHAAGIGYLSIPVTHAGFSRPQIDAMAQALDKPNSKILAYCRSGTRSTLLWALAQAAGGESPRIIAVRAEEAGYDVSPIAMMLDALSASVGDKA
jgi:uncharacterized protein (TIGR01244 family)